MGFFQNVFQGKSQDPFPRMEAQGSLMDLSCIFVFSETPLNPKDLPGVVEACLSQWGLQGVNAHLRGKGDKLQLADHETRVLPLVLRAGQLDRYQKASSGTMAEFAPLLGEGVIAKHGQDFAQQLFPSDKTFRSRSTSLQVDGRKVLGVALAMR